MGQSLINGEVWAGGMAQWLGAHTVLLQDCVSSHVAAHTQQ